MTAWSEHPCFHFLGMAEDSHSSVSENQTWQLFLLPQENPTHPTYWRKLPFTVLCKGHCGFCHFKPPQNVTYGPLSWPSLVKDGFKFGSKLWNGFSLMNLRISSMSKAGPTKG